MAAGRCNLGAYHRGSLCSKRPWTVCLSAHACSRPGRWMALLLLICRQKAMVARAKARAAGKRVPRRSGSAVPKLVYEISGWDWGLGLDGTISHTVNSTTHHEPLRPQIQVRPPVLSAARSMAAHAIEGALCFIVAGRMSRTC